VIVGGIVWDKVLIGSDRPDHRHDR
jgi:hypothetical protein